MSDKCYPVILNWREINHRYADGLWSDPGLCGVTLIDGMWMSPVSCVGDHLAVWQDDDSKQVFWAEWQNIGDYQPSLKFRDDPTHSLQEQYGLWTLYHQKMEQFTHFIFGWGAQWGSYSLDERRLFIKRVRKAMESAPSDNWINALQRWHNYKELPIT